MPVLNVAACGEGQLEPDFRHPRRAVQAHADRHRTDQGDALDRAIGEVFTAIPMAFSAGSAKVASAPRMKATASTTDYRERCSMV